MRPTARITPEMIRKGLNAYNMQKGDDGCKNLKADPATLHNALKYAGVTMAPD